MQNLPAELLLRVADCADVPTLNSLIIANKDIASLVLSHERSICKHQSSKFILQPTGSILSSLGPVRRVLRAHTFHSVLELELRDTRINAILRSGILDLAGPGGMQPLTMRQQERLAWRLKRAIYHCDQLADIAANTPFGPRPEFAYDLTFTGVYSTVNKPPELRNADLFTNLHARDPQIDFIRSLPVSDLAVLYLLIVLAGTGFLRRRSYNASDPSVHEKVTVFEECILRHGSWFLWSHVRGREDMKIMSGHMIAAGLAELTDWETGREGMKPGLRMSLLDALKEKLAGREQGGGGVEDEELGWNPDLHSKIYGQIEMLISDRKENIGA